MLKIFSKYALEWRFFIVALTTLILFLLILTNSINSKQSLSLKSLLFFHPSLTSHDDHQTPPLKERIAICLVGGARRFELTGPSIIKNLLEAYPNADLFLHSPLDKDSYKFSLLKSAPRIASVKIFVPQRIQEAEEQTRVLTSNNSPNGIQGLLQYFNLVEGCLDLIISHETKYNLTYDWIVRTRVDSYWSGPLDRDAFRPGSYVIPKGSRYDGLNDRLGVGDHHTSTVALSRLALISQLDAAGFRGLNSESVFKAQLNVSGVQEREMQFPFCVVSDRQYSFPPARYGVPVVSMNSMGPLSGAKCRPCSPICTGQCVTDTIDQLDMNWSWIEYRNKSVSLCDASGQWPNGWETIFDDLAGEEAAKERKRVRSLNVKGCIEEFKEMRRRTENWEAPKMEKICRLGLD